MSARAFRGSHAGVMSSTCTEGQAKNVPGLLKSKAKQKSYGLARYRVSSVTFRQLS